MNDAYIVLTLVTLLTFVLAGFVKGVIGLGLPTVAVGLLGLVMPPAQAVSLLVVPSLVTNVWQLAAGPAFVALARRLWPMLLGVCVGTWFGAGHLTADANARAPLFLGIALALYAVLGLSKKRFSVPAHAEPWIAPAIGILTGTIAAATGVFVLPAVPYLQALGLSFTVSTLALAAVLMMQGSFHLSAASASLAALAPAIAGMRIGQWVRTRVRAETFRLFFFSGLLLLGGHLALRTVM